MQPLSLRHGFILVLLLSPFAVAQDPVRGERIPADAISPLVAETMEVVIERDRNRPADPPARGGWSGEAGRWLVPPEGAKTPAHSGMHAVVNEWGDPVIGIGFGGEVDVAEVFAAGHGVAPSPSLVFVGFRAGAEVARTEPQPIGDSHRAVALAFARVDRIEVHAAPFATTGRGFFALDDLRFAGAGGGAERVLDFEDLSFRDVLTGSGYAGLVWESGTGLAGLAQDGGDIVPAPRAPAEAGDEVPVEGGAQPAGGNATSPAVWQDYIGVVQGDPGANLIPPDTCGANGPDHYVVIVNSNLSAYRKSDRMRLLSVSLGSFWGASGTVGDPRAVYDPHGRRFVVMATNFSGGRTLFYAVSANSDPTGTWFKFSFRTDQGSDAGRWPDYPTLGVDARGLYSAAYMVGSGARMTIWAIDKAPLLANPPSVGTITAFRSLPWEGAIQPCTTYGDPGGEYLVSRQSSTSLRVRRINGPLTAPTLIEVGSVSVPSHSNPPNAPALGSTTPISTIDTRPMNAVFRAGSLFTVHGISSAGRAACRWYEVRVSPPGLVQYGTLDDPLWHYYYAAVAVDAQGNVALGCSGSHANAYCSVFVTGRRASDPAGQTAPLLKIKDGEGPWNRLDGSGRNRFGDYSHIDVDPNDELGFWTLQEYILPGNRWATRLVQLGYEAFEYGSGLSGQLGVPALGVVARPVIGQTSTLQIGNSRPATSVGALALGLQRANLPLLGGTLLVNPLLALTVTIPAAGASLGVPLPADAGLVGNPVVFQVLVVDGAAAQGLAFSRGLELRPASR